MPRGLLQELLNLQQSAASRWVRMAASGGGTSQLICVESYRGNGSISKHWQTAAYGLAGDVDEIRQPILWYAADA